MKKRLLYALVLSAVMPLSAQEKKENKEGYVFTTVKENPITSVKDQNRSGTCWSFSGIGFLEAEMLRMGKPETDLSEMFAFHTAIPTKPRNMYVCMAHAILPEVALSTTCSMY
jgi:Papain family cysteine protease.